MNKNSFLRFIFIGSFLINLILIISLIIYLISGSQEFFPIDEDQEKIQMVIGLILGLLIISNIIAFYFYRKISKKLNPPKTYEEQEK